VVPSALWAVTFASRRGLALTSPANSSLGQDVSAALGRHGAGVDQRAAHLLSE